IAITTAFSGTDVLVFGTTGEPGGEVIVVARGPLGTETVRQKTRVGLIWLNTQQVAFRGVPAYYALAASKPLAELVPEDELARYQIGLERLRFGPVDASGLSEEELNAFGEALVRNKQRAGLYSERVAKVTFLGGNLFRTTLTFPANVPPG